MSIIIIDVTLICLNTNFLCGKSINRLICFPKIRVVFVVLNSVNTLITTWPKARVAGVRGRSRVLGTKLSWIQIRKIFGITSTWVLVCNLTYLSRRLDGNADVCGSDPWIVMPSLYNNNYYYTPIIRRYSRVRHGYENGYRVLGTHRVCRLARVRNSERFGLIIVFNIVEWECDSVTGGIVLIMWFNYISVGRRDESKKC